MYYKIQKWGNSLAIRLPKHITDSVGLKENSRVTISAENETISIKPVPEKMYRLEDLVQAIDEQNVHKETDTDLPQGNEVW